MNSPSDLSNITSGEEGIRAEHEGPKGRTGSYPGAKSEIAGPASMNSSTDTFALDQIANRTSQIVNPESLNPQPSTLNSPHGGPHVSVRAQVAIEATPDTADPDILHIRASDETLDRYKEVIAASGWRLENYLRNPVIQNAHQYGDIIFTIGRAEKTWVSGNALLQTWRFASNENPFAKIARDLYRGKFLQAASVGFIPIKWEDGDDLTRNHTLTHNPGTSDLRSPTTAPFRRRYIEQELLEVSAVGIPANPNALTMALQKGAIEKSDLRELFQLLKHLVGRDSVEPSPSPRWGEGRGEVFAFASLLPDLRFLRSLLNPINTVLQRGEKTTNRKET